MRYQKVIFYLPNIPQTVQIFPTLTDREFEELRALNKHLTVERTAEGVISIQVLPDSPPLIDCDGDHGTI